MGLEGGRSPSKLEAAPFAQVQSRGGRDLLPEDYPEFSSEEDDDDLSRDETLRSARKQKVKHSRGRRKGRRA